MITLIHGSDTALSRKYFMDEKQKANDAVILDADSVNLTDLTQLFDGGGLFGETKYLFIEQLLTKRKKSADLPEILNYLEKNGTEHTIILWEGKELERGSLMLLKTATVRIFKLPQSLFQFLDTLAPGNGKILIKLFRQTIETSETEMVFFMLIRQIRILLALNGAQSQTSEAIDEAKKLAPWQKSKLEKQANLFKPDQLLTLYDKLFQIELGQKTGTLGSPLDSTIDFLLVEV
jgi:DNA polymerase III delta subunit